MEGVQRICTPDWSNDFDADYGDGHVGGCTGRELRHRKRDELAGDIPHVCAAIEYEWTVGRRAQETAARPKARMLLDNEQEDEAKGRRNRYSEQEQDNDEAGGHQTEGNRETAVVGGDELHKDLTATPKGFAR